MTVLFSLNRFVQEVRSPVVPNARGGFIGLHPRSDFLPSCRKTSFRFSKDLDSGQERDWRHCGSLLIQIHSRYINTQLNWCISTTASLSQAYNIIQIFCRPNPSGRWWCLLLQWFSFCLRLTATVRHIVKIIWVWEETLLKLLEYKITSYAHGAVPKSCPTKPLLPWEISLH